MMAVKEAMYMSDQQQEDIPARKIDPPLIDARTVLNAVQAG